MRTLNINETDIVSGGSNGYGMVSAGMNAALTEMINLFIPYIYAGAMTVLAVGGAIATYIYVQNN